MNTQEVSYLDELYYFETDHVALKENIEYRNLLRTIAMLEAQRHQACLDIEELIKAQVDALSDPFGFVNKLQQGKNLFLPKAQFVVPLPEIPWHKYSSLTSFNISRHMTRNKIHSAGDKIPNVKCRLSQVVDTSQTQPIDQAMSDADVIVIRGRARDSSKSATFNQLWTDEEQQRLESLLSQFPPEEIESRRWAKIASALGNRTAVQVASRVQKYFLRLAKEGLPVPGRTPSLSSYVKKGPHRHHRYNRMYYPQSTFMQSHTPPVWMKEDNDDYEVYQADVKGLENSNGDTTSVSETTSLKNEQSSDDEMFPEELKNSQEYRELQQLLNIKTEKLTTEHIARVQHVGFKCDRCGCDPIVGTRWHCIDCHGEQSLDFCDDCCDVSYQEDKHDSSHRLHPFHHASLDLDYMGYSHTDYNYLDPNFMPAH